MITSEDKSKLAQNIKHTRLVDTSRRLARIVKHVDPCEKKLTKRIHLEKNLSDWLHFFGGEAFSSPWSPDHIKVLNKIGMALNKGGLFALAMPRGQGKTTILKWVIAYVLFTGLRKYVMFIAATADLAQSIVDFARAQITESDLLHEYYPHVTTYARATDGKAIKARYQLRADGKASGILWSKTTLVFPEVLSADKKLYPSNGAILETHGLTGAIRGKCKDTKTGKTLRPDFVILDDPQDRESAESPSQCSRRERIIMGDVLGSAGPKKRITAIMACTIIRKGDLADRFLDHKLHPEWQGEICRLVNKWPDAQETLWKEYDRIYREETGEGRGFAKATEFYKSQQTEMNAGAEVSWPHRVRDGEISALQTAENLRIESGPQFWAEYQNEPLDSIGSMFEITPALICGHAINISHLVLPEWVTVFVGHCDINRNGLHWCLVGFGQDMTGHCPAYGRWPERGDLWQKNAPELVRKQAIFAGLRSLCAAIAASSFSKSGRHIIPSLLLIDRGYEPDVVHKFAATVAYPFRVFPARGYAAHKYHPVRSMLIGKPLEGCHQTKSDFGPYLAFNADLWRETAQRAFLAEPGAPGGMTLFAADSHVRFAEQVCAEKLTNKYETDAGLRWEWRHEPGAEWDWGDALTGCWVAAAASGLSASGQPKINIPVRNMRRMRHIAI